MRWISAPSSSPQVNLETERRTVPPWLAELHCRGYSIISGVPCAADNHALREIGAVLGEPSLRALSPHPLLREPHGVQRVQALKQPSKNRFGRRLRSSDAAGFPLHSDEAFLPDPARWVLLHCWQADPAGGGASLICERQALIDAASPDQIDALYGHQLRYPCGRFAVLTDRLVRFNADDYRIENSADRQWVNEVVDLAQRSAIEILLRPGDCLIIANQRCLHGRRRFAPDSPRLLKRLRVV